MDRPFLGVGWQFPISLDSETGKIKLAEYDESIRQSIWTILGTAKGERVMRPDFGCGIHDLVFGVITAFTAGQIAQVVKETLLHFETRIDVLDVQVHPGDNEEVLYISIDYKIRTTNNAFNLVYPFYLERSAG
jgi:phage baseplate assembly protein W